MAIQYAGHDTDLAQAVVLQLGSGSKIEFQFPPRMVSDNRSGTWKEKEMPGKEPNATFRLSGAREMTLAWTYIVDGQTWSTDKIAKNVKALRGYFAKVRGASVPGKNLIVKFKMWLVGGKDTMSCRIRSITVKHSDTIVGQGDNAYPLRTDITVDLRLWTKANQDGKHIPDIPLNNDITPDWY